MQLNNSTKTYIPYVEIPKKLDINADETLLVASGIRKLATTAAHFEKNFVPQTFIHALQQKVQSGTLLFPAFINSFENGASFDIKHSPPQTGTLSVAAFKDPDFIRTNDPFHSFMVWGKHANALATINNKSTFGNDSAFAFLHQHKAKMLLIDIDLDNSFTFVHYVEEMEKIRYRRFLKYSINCINYNGVKENRDILFFAKYASIKVHLSGLYDLLKKNGALKEYKMNDSVFTIIDFEKSAEIIKTDIRSNSAANLHRTSYVLWMKLMIKKLISPHEKP